jgi:CheY-like chemotaxis protein
MRPHGSQCHTAPDMTTRPKILVMDADPALLGLLDEWMADLAEVTSGRSESAEGGDCDLLVVDVAFPRQGESNPLRRLAGRYPHTPVLALSSTFFHGIDAHGAVARSLGVAGVLPKPVGREALLAAVRRLLSRQA